jgi:hypothetical protein
MKEGEVSRACNMNGSKDECLLFIGRRARSKETTRKAKTIVGG